MRDASCRRNSPRPSPAYRTKVAPEFREFERMSTVVVNAYLGPVMQGYIRRLGKRLADLGVHATPYLTQSNGGVIGFAQAARLPVRAVLSGPSTGVVGAQEVGRLAGFADLITFDMGGTSTDVALATGRPVPARQRGRGARLSDQGADVGYPHSRCGRRFYRLCRQRGAAEGRDRAARAPTLDLSATRAAMTKQTVTDANVVLQTLKSDAPTGWAHGGASGPCA